MIPNQMLPASPLLVTSPKNPLLKKIKKATDRGTLTDDGYCIAESFHLVEEAIRSGCELEAVVVSETAEAKAANHQVAQLPPRRIVIPDLLFRDIAATESTQGVLAVVRPREWAWNDLFTGNPLLVVLDGLQDPGNAGAILRAAEAFGATGTVALKGTVNLFNPKAMRGSAGSIFRHPILGGVELTALLAELERRDVTLFAAMPHAPTGMPQVHFSGASAIVVGSEGSGVRPELAAIAKPFRIPTVTVESLNASIAAAVVLYEARRQRGGTA